MRIISSFLRVSRAAFSDDSEAGHKHSTVRSHVGKRKHGQLLVLTVLLLELCLLGSQALALVLLTADG
jgi:hypothetical protein